MKTIQEFKLHQQQLVAQGLLQLVPVRKPVVQMLLLVETALKPLTVTPPLWDTNLKPAILPLRLLVKKP